MADTNTTTLIGKLTNIADGFRSSRSLTETLSLDEMATLAAVPIGSTDNKLAQLVDRTITEITAEDLAGITNIGTFAFSGCVNLISITIPNSVTTIGSNGFSSCSSLTSIIIPNSVLSMGSNMFQYCSALTSAVIGNGIQTLESSAFNSCSNLESVTIGSRVTNIRNSAFYRCRKLTSVTIPNSVTSIGDQVFEDCQRLTSITIPNRVTSIGHWSLQIGTSTNKATMTFLGTTPPSIATTTINTSKLEKIIVPAGSGEAYKSATNWANYADYIEEATA